MKRASSLIPLLMSALSICASNPIVQTWFTPDPAPYVHNDTVYLFTGHDEDDAQYFKMKDWQLHTSDDMVNWTFRGFPISTATFSWAKQGDNAWASQAIERDGKWFWYICAEDTVKGLHGIGVAVADRPEGPYADPLGKPLVPGNWGYIDPSVFIDDDGQAYLFWGNNGLWWAKLNRDMISLDGDVIAVETLNDTDQFGPQVMKMDYQVGERRMKTGYEEGPWVFKRNGKYYLVYAAGGVPEHMAYSVADKIEGPWRYMGKIQSESPGSFTIHGGSIEFKGRNFIFYHTGLLPNGGGFRRSSAVEEFSWRGDTIPFIPFTEKGVIKPIKNLDPYRWVEAETMAESFGLKTDRTQGNHHYITSVNNGDWLGLKNVDFGTIAPAMIKTVARTAKNDSKIQFRLDNLGGPVIGEVILSPSADWEETLTKINGETTGVHDLYLLFIGGEGEILEMDRWQLVGK